MTFQGIVPQLVMNAANGPDDRGLLDWPEYSPDNEIVWMEGWGERSDTLFTPYYMWTANWGTTPNEYFTNMISPADGGPWKPENFKLNTNTNGWGCFPASVCMKSAAADPRTNRNVAIAMDVATKPIDIYNQDTEWTTPRGFAVGIKHGKRNAMVTMLSQTNTQSSSSTSWLGSNNIYNYTRDYLAQSGSSGIGAFDANGNPTTIAEFFDTSETSRVYLLFNQKTGEALYFEVNQFMPAKTGEMPWYPDILFYGGSGVPHIITITLRYRESFDATPQILSDEFTAYSPRTYSTGYPIVSANVIDNTVTMKLAKWLCFKLDGYEDPDKPGEDVWRFTYNNYGGVSGTWIAPYLTITYTVPDELLANFDKEENSPNICSGLGVVEQRQFPWVWGKNPFTPSGPDQWYQKFVSAYSSVYGPLKDGGNPELTSTSVWGQTLFIGTFQVNGFDNRPGEYIPQEWFTWQSTGNITIFNGTKDATAKGQMPTPVTTYSPSTLPTEGWYPSWKPVLPYPSTYTEWRNQCTIADWNSYGNWPSSYLPGTYGGRYGLFGQYRFTEAAYTHDRIIKSGPLDSNLEMFDTWRIDRPSGFASDRIVSDYGVGPTVSSTIPDPIKNWKVWPTYGTRPTSSNTPIFTEFPSPIDIVGGETGIVEMEQNVWIDLLKPNKTDPDSAFTPAIKIKTWALEWMRWESSHEVLIAIDPKKWPVPPPPPPPPPPVTTIPPLHIVQRADGLRAGGANWARRGRTTRQGGLHLGPANPL